MRSETEIVAMRLFESCGIRTEKGPLNWYAIGLQRRNLWRLLAMAMLAEDLPYASPKNVKTAWDELRPFIPNGLSEPRP